MVQLLHEIGINKKLISKVDPPTVARGVSPKNWPVLYNSTWDHNQIKTCCKFTHLMFPYQFPPVFGWINGTPYCHLRGPLTTRNLARANSAKRINLSKGRTTGLRIGKSSRWWLNQPIWKILYSQTGSFHQGSGWKLKKIELPPPSHPLMADGESFWIYPTPQNPASSLSSPVVKISVGIPEAKNVRILVVTSQHRGLGGRSNKCMCFFLVNDV